MGMTLINEIRQVLADASGAEHISAFSDILATAIVNSDLVLTAGNGGSAADACHFAAELVVRYKHDRRAIGAVSLAADPAVLTAAGNDLGFDKVFSRQIEGLARPGDVVVLFSTSGKSPNILRAAKTAVELGAEVFAFLGQEINAKDWQDCFCMLVPSKNTAVIQTCHQIIYHTVCEKLDEMLCATR